MDNILKILAEIRPEVNFENSKNFIEDGYLDSFDIVALVSTLEETYNILIDALDILPENFSNVEAIYNLLKKNGADL